VFFQLVLCVAIWSVGFVVHCTRGFPPIYFLPILGGALWTTVNTKIKARNLFIFIDI
jgi:hypothetical protein